MSADQPSLPLDDELDAPLAERLRPKTLGEVIGQQSLLRFDAFAANAPVAAEAFRFTPPAGADVIEQ